MKFIDRYNTVYGAAVTVLTALFGAYWYVFAAYLACNVLDYFTGWWKARKHGTESSEAGTEGILKKFGYWVIIFVAFLIPWVLTSIGQDMLGIDLSFLALLGWYTLATMLINEVRSILENLVECGCSVPEFLIRGLAVTEKILQAKIEISEKNEETDNRVGKAVCDSATVDE